MTNNDVLRKLRYSFNYGDDKMMEIFGHVGLEVTRAELSDWLKKDEDPDFKVLPDLSLANFLNGLIIEKRGKKDGPLPIAEDRLNNNLIFKKLKIALNLKTEDVMALFHLVEFKVSPHEITALLRNPKQSQYRPCKDQFLRNFIYGIEKKWHRTK